MEQFDQTPDDLRGVAKRVRDERDEWSGSDLDRIKLRAMAQAAKNAGEGKANRGMPMRRRMLVAALSVLAVGGVVTGGIAATNKGGQKDAAQAQYGPPETCPNGQPKPPGGNCGNPQGPPETCPNGQPKPPSGNCGRSPHDEAEARDAARKKCREQAKKSRARNAAAKKRHRTYLARYRGAKHRRLAREFKQQERTSNAATTSRYKKCRAQADQA
jgi:hypothetical protein